MSSQVSFDFLAAPAARLPDRFEGWFGSRGWTPREHQLALLEKARENRSALLIAPTGAGKTLAGFLPTLVELGTSAPPGAQLPLPSRGRPPPEGRQEGGRPPAPESVAQSFISTGRTVKRTGGLHTLYISIFNGKDWDISDRPVTE